MKLLSDSRRLRKFIIWLEGLRTLEAASQAARGGRRGATGAGPRLASPADSRGALGLGCQAANKRAVGGAEGVAISIPAPRRRVCSAPTYAPAQPSSSSIGRGESLAFHHQSVTVWEPDTHAKWRGGKPRVPTTTITTFVVWRGESCPSWRRRHRPHVLRVEERC